MDEDEWFQLVVGTLSYNSGINFVTVPVLVVDSYDETEDIDEE